MSNQNKIKNLKNELVYRVTRLFENPDRTVSEQDDSEYIVQGMLDDAVIVSVPMTMTHAYADGLAVRLADAFPGKTVVITTHNIQFLVAERLTEAEKVQLQSRLNAETPLSEESPQ